MIHQDEITLDTHGHGDMHRVDGEVQGIVNKAGITQGLANVFNVGSTGAVVMVEFEPGLQRDLPEILNQLIPPGTHYGHEQAWHDGNAHSHLQASLLGPSFTVPVQDGQLQLGTWQQIIHLECDNKPRHRRLVVTIQGE